MNKRYLFLLASLCTGVYTEAQDIQVNLNNAYVFDNHVDSYYDNTAYYKGAIKGSYQWGVGMEYRINPVSSAELSYTRQDTKAPMTYYYNGTKFTNFDLAANYIMVGSNRYLSKSGSRLEGYAGGMAGLAVMHLKNPDNGYSGDKVKFAWGLKLGGHFWATQWVGLKLQAQLLSAVQSVGGGFYFGSGGSGSAIATYSTVFQFGLGGGLVFKFPAQKHVQQNQSTL